MEGRVLRLCDLESLGRRLLCAALLVVAPLATGCIGVIRYYDVVDQIDAPQIAPYDRRTLYSRPTWSRMTRADLEHLWGPPDSVEFVEGAEGAERVERWNYESDTWHLHGIMPVLILPLPLVLPYGNSRVTMTLEGDEVTSAESLRSSGGCALIGPFMGPEGLKWYDNTWNESGPRFRCVVNPTWLEHREPSH